MVNFSVVVCRIRLFPTLIFNKNIFFHEWIFLRLNNGFDSKLSNKSTQNPILVSKLPGIHHLRVRPRKCLKEDVLFRNPRVDRSYWYHFSSFLILCRFSQSVFENLHPRGISKKTRIEPIHHVINHFPLLEWRSTNDKTENQSNDGWNYFRIFAAWFVSTLIAKSNDVKVKDGICRWQVRNVGDRFEGFCHQR